MDPHDCQNKRVQYQAKQKSSIWECEYHTTQLAVKLCVLHLFSSDCEKDFFLAKCYIKKEDWYACVLGNSGNDRRKKAGTVDAAAFMYS